MTTATRPRLRLRRRCRSCTVPVLSVDVTPRRAQREMSGIVTTSVTRRLLRCGLVHGRRRADGAWAVCLTSLCEHLVGSSEPGYWTPERTALYERARHA